MARLPNPIGPRSSASKAAAVLASLLLAGPGCQVERTAAPAPPPAPETVARAAPDPAGSRAAFLAAYRVLLHPRCMNCHPAGDVPLQGDDSRPHAQNVQRGRDGKGLLALRCAGCHQDANLPGENMPPGNPNWHLPRPGMPLVFQGKSPRELALQLKDPAHNGGKTLGQLLEHVAKDPLVLAGWDPGEGRTKPPLSHEDFVRAMRDWVEQGAAIPE